MGPKTLGDILTGTLGLYRTAFLGIVMIVAVVQVPLSILGFWFGSILENALVELVDKLDSSTSFDSETLIEVFREVFYVGFILLVASWLTIIVMEGALICGVSDRIIGRTINVGRAYSFAVGRFGAMLGASILSVVAVLLMAITIIGIPFAIFFTVRWLFVMQTASLQRCNPPSALARSSELVQDNWWRVFGILLLIGILSAIVNGILSAALGQIPYAGSVVAAVLLAPVMIIAQTLLYHDLRVRRETPAGYNLEVLAVELQSRSAL